MIISKTPFRVSFFGGGTDYPEWFSKYKGSVISLAINKYCYVSARELPGFFSNKHRVVWSKIELINDFEKIIHPAVREALKYYKPSVGIEINHQGDLPARAGLGSSSSFAVGLINSLNSFVNKKKISKKKISQEAIFLEQNLVKEKVGIQDQIITSYGGFNNIKIDYSGNFKVNKINLSQDDILNFTDSLLLIYTGQTRIASKIASIKIKSFKSKINEMENLSELVKEGKKLIEKKSYDDFGYLLHQTWMLKKSINKVISNDKIDEIYHEALQSGALGGKLLGAGGGGFMIFYVRKSDRKKVLEKLNKLLHVPFNVDYEGTKIIYNSL